MRLWPQQGMEEGHFIAILQRTSGVRAQNAPPMQPSRPDHEAARLFQDFRTANLTAEFVDTRLSKAGSYLYHIPAGMPDLAGLKAIHPGLWLGTLKKDRFEPSHALALAMRPDEARQSLALEPGEAVSYLRGNTLDKKGIDGWVLLTVDGFPLGWGKRSQGVIKNFYPKGLRR
jgi:NOL1/NOP2/fmu family ribosome biogenesis protein